MGGVGVLPAPQWYALQTRSRHEKVADRLLSEKGFATFLPLTVVRSPVSLRRFREAQIPLFPGYTFARFSCSNEDQHRVLQTTGVARIVRTRSGPVSIPDLEIESLKALVSQRIRCSLSPSFAVGQRVLVIAGPLKGVQGEIIRRKNRQAAFVVKVGLLRRMLEVDSNPFDLEILPQ